MSKNGNGVMIIAGALIVLFLYLRSQVGDQAALTILVYLAGIATGVVLTALGGRINDSSQRNFIDLMRHSKSAMTASVREESRTQGAVDRAKLRQAGQPTQLSPEMQEWIDKQGNKFH